MNGAMSWYVARTKPTKEQEAAAALRQRGVEVYLPILRKSKPRPGRRDWEPFFPCYLFASLEVPSDTWLAARCAPYVAYFLGHQGQPTALPEGLMPALTARVELANGHGGLPGFKRGERVIITHGPFRSLDAIFDRSLSADGRSRVLVQTLHRLVPVQLREEHLKAG
jgi:transcription antitermination factor NusG